MNDDEAAKDKAELFWHTLATAPHLQRLLSEYPINRCPTDI
jgi:hypothetical protein